MSTNMKNKAIVKLTQRTGSDDVDISVTGDMVVTSRIPSLVVQTAQLLTEQYIGAADDPAEVLGAIWKKHLDTDWTLVFTYTPSTEEFSTEGWDITRDPTDLDDRVLGPVLVLLAYLMENEDFSRKLQTGEGFTEVTA